MAYNGSYQDQTLLTEKLQKPLSSNPDSNFDWRVGKQDGYEVRGDIPAVRYKRSE
jgi:hypothetical protein